MCFNTTVTYNSLFKTSALPEISYDEDGHKQGAEGHSVADGIHDVKTLKEVFL